MKCMLRALLIGILTVLVCGPAIALEDDFATPLSTEWAAPSTPLVGASITSALPDAAALDGFALELVYPGPTAASYTGPAWATQLRSATARGYGTYSARLRVAAAPGRGLISAFFTYFNDGVDHDGDGLVDNHEIDYEFPAAEPAAIYMTVWTAYQLDTGGEKFRKFTRKVNLRTGRVWQTPPGGEGTYDLVEIAPLGWKVRGFMTTRAYRTYRFDWQPTEVTFEIDLEDGQGFRPLWDLTGAPNTVIPTHTAPCYLNLFHNATNWKTGRRAAPPLRPAHYRIDHISVP